MKSQKSKVKSQNHKLKVKNLYDKYVLNTYTKTDLCLVKGKDEYVWDIEGRKYLDFFPGWAVSGIGHCNKYVIKNIRKQLNKIIHVSNNYYNELQGELSEVIIKNSFEGKVFYANSGSEANEGAIKLARKFGSPDRFEVITMEKSFHGRTLATLAATGQDKVKKGFEPLPSGFLHVPFNDINALKNAINPKTIAVMIELVQGEGGINIADKEYIAEIRKICDEKNLLLIIDEVQTGIGRTGKMFAYEHYGIEPDIMTLAKSLGGGMPIGAMVVKEKFSGVLTPGSHASTFGGGPLVSAAALGVFEAIKKDRLLNNVNKMSKYFENQLNKLKKKKQIIKKINILGLMIGLEIDMDDADVIYKKCLSKGLLINCTQNNILRIMPPLSVDKKEISDAVEILEASL